MKLSRQQRINNVGSQIVSEMRLMSEGVRKMMKEGLDWPAQDGYPPLKCTGDEVRSALGDNAKEVETILEFILDGKSNRIKKGK